MIYVFICVISGVAGALVARAKGSNMVIWFLVAGVAPIIGVMAAVAMRSEREELRRECPVCGRVLKLHDQLCRCGAELYFPDEAIESPADAERHAATTA